MLSRTLRLPYEKFRAPGYRKVITPYFSVGARRDPLGKHHFGVVVGISSVKSAARRSFWRRQAKSAFLEVTEKIQPDNKKGFDILVVFRSGAPLPEKRVFKKMLAETIASLISHL